VTLKINTQHTPYTYDQSVLTSNVAYFARKTSGCEATRSRGLDLRWRGCAGQELVDVFLNLADLEMTGFVLNGFILVFFLMNTVKNKPNLTFWHSCNTSSPLPTDSHYVINLKKQTPHFHLNESCFCQFYFVFQLNPQHTALSMTLAYRPRPNEVLTLIPLPAKVE
jgi:hypothetical protein